jgi:hypothetical protein
MREIQDYVSAVPGCSRADALRAAGLPTQGIGVGKSLNRLISRGLIIQTYVRGNLCALFENERARERFELRRELLQPGCSAGRVQEIREQLDVLDAESVATWTR